jgi:5S rRNA maturation endonuclease (ribonuclease M5)
MKMTIKKSHSHDQFKLKALSDLVCDDIENLLAALNITDYKMLDKMVSMSCPIHGGDNASAFNLYHQGDTYRGNWKCRTHQCEQTFKSSIIGFIRGCLSNSKYGWTKDGDQVVSFQDAVDFATKFTNKTLADISISRKQKEKCQFVNTVKYIATAEKSSTPKISRSFIRKNLAIPSSYFLNRGFSKEVLNSYDVGECLTQGKEMCNRAVAPIYDIDYQYMVGCTGRSLFEKCDQCKAYHDPKESCPAKENVWKYSKWRHSYGFKTEEHLYNFWKAKNFVKDHHAIILVESPGNVWRLEEAGINNAVAMFGSSLSDRQKMLLDISGAMTIITIMDNDEAGRNAAKKIFKKCEKTYNIFDVSINYSDLAEMTVDQINAEIKPLLRKYFPC